VTILLYIRWQNSAKNVSFIQKRYRIKNGDKEIVSKLCKKIRWK